MPAARRSQPKAKFIPVAATRLAPAPVNLFAGTSGWAYPSWKPDFYPAYVPSRAFLHFYATQFTSVEVNYTFRTLPSAAQLQGWLDATPPGFRFGFKAPQRITHFERLRVSHDRKNGHERNSSHDGNNTQEQHGSLATFLAALKPARSAAKLGPLLFQLPPNFAIDTERLAAFLDSPILADPQLRLAFEFRHASWFTGTTYELLRARNAALCIAESDDLATPDVATADFRCYRLRRNGGYTAAELDAFAGRFTALAAQGEVFAYFKHEEAPTGALNALVMLRHAASLQDPAAPEGASGRHSRTGALA